jgi:UDP-N-acetylmuramyl pentapeptide phosphotransferase/UDP-N-acetylglucosamine-1-phosphate transferase
MTFQIILSLCAFVMALLGTRLFIMALRKRPLPPEIAHLRGQIRHVPRGGGIVLAFVLIICLMVADIGYGIVLSLLLLTAISLLDSMIEVPLPVRLLVQVMAITVPLSLLDQLLFGGMLPPSLDKTITGLLWLAFINSFKSMDHIDGLAATQMICIGGGLALLTAMADIFSSELYNYGLIVAAAGAGFLWWNWPPAKIRLNDAGSVPVGFLIGYLLLLASMQGYAYAALILSAYCLSDGILTQFRRLFKGRSHEAYYYQKALHNGRHEDNIVRYVFGIHILLIFLAIRSVIEPDIAVFHLSMAYFTVFILLGWLAHTHPHTPHETR